MLYAFRASCVFWACLLIALLLMSCTSTPSICDGSIFDASQTDPTRYDWQHQRPPYTRIAVTPTTQAEVHRLCEGLTACVIPLSSSDALLVTEGVIPGDLLLHEALHGAGWVHPTAK